MKLFAGLILSAVVAQDYYDEEGERKKKNMRNDACGCTDKPKNAPDAVATCVEVSKKVRNSLTEFKDGGKRKTIDWTCPATGEVERMSNVKCRKIKKKALMNQCGELTCNCKSEMDAFVALMNPDAGEAVASCTIAKKKPTYKLFCDEDSSGTHDAAEASQTFKVKCRNGGIRKNKFDQLLCGNAIIGKKNFFFQNFVQKNISGGDGWEAGPGSMVPGLTCAAPGAPFTARRKRKIKSSAHSKIVGGQIVNRETTWPWIVRLPGCGGSIITQNPTGENDWILTGKFFEKRKTIHFSIYF